MSGLFYAINYIKKLLLRAFPLDMMLIQNILYIVIIADISEPSIQAFHDNDINPSCAHIIEKPVQAMTARKGFACGASFVCVQVYDIISFVFRVLSQVAALLRQAESVLCLLVR